MTGQLFKTMPVRENVLLGAQSGTSWLDEHRAGSRALELLESAQPELLMLDEPSLGLAPLARATAALLPFNRYHEET